MALVVKLNKVGVNEEGTEYYVSDGTGVYQAASGIVFTVADVGANLLNSVGHGLITGSIVTLETATTLPDPLDVNTQYSVILQDADNFKLGIVTDPLSEIDILDVGTGEHTFLSGVNLGGYGTPNEERGDVALILVSMNKVSTGDVEKTITFYDPETVANWTIDIDDADGVYETTLFALKKIVGGEAEGEVAYNVGTKEVMKLVSAVWVALSAEELLAEDSPGIDTDILVDLIVVNSTVIKNTLNREVTEALSKYTQKLCDYETVFAKQNDYNYVRTLLEGAVIQFCRANYTLAQENIETLETYYKGL